MRRAFFPVKLFVILFAAVLGLGSGKVYAAEGSFLQILVKDNEVLSYIECSGSIQSADAQVAQYPCENVEITVPGDISVHTVILLDNSLSISEKNRENIKNILRQYMQEIPENEVVSLAVFGEDMQFLAEKSQDGEEMLKLVDEMEFNNQDTYLTDYLFQALEKIQNDQEYTRFIVISDGVDNKAIGITKEELSEKLKEVPRTVCTIGHIYKDNSEELKNMFALSRMTNGKEYLIEDFDDISLLAEEIHDFSDIYAVKMEIPQNVMDGDSRHILLNIHTDEGDISITGETDMPFTLIEPEPEKEEEPEPEPEPEPIPEPEPEPVPEPVPQPAEETEKGKTGGIGIEKIAGASIAVAAIVLLIFQKRRKGSEQGSEKKKKNAKKKKETIPVMLVTQEPSRGNGQEENVTTILGGRYLLTLRDRENPERIFRYPMDRHVIVGRNIDMVQIVIDYNLTVSGQHCEFYIRNNRFFVRDMNSANHTYLDGRMIQGESEIASGNIVRLGEVEFSIEIMPI